MKNKPKISIITVSYNAVKTIEQTILSVINQSYSNIEYIIIDGGSTDGTVDIIKKYQDRLAYWVSEPDTGMYDALVKGLKHVTGDICAYINADDFYQLYAFDIVSEVFENSSRKWITGITTIYNDKSQIVEARVPYIYRNGFIKKGLYNGEILPYIQQESTFWRTELLREVDFEKLSRIKYAGDFYLWKCFAKKAELNIVRAILSGFRIIQGQLSENIEEYKLEMKALSEKNNNVLDWLQVLFDHVYAGFPIRFNKNIIKYNYEKNRWE
jgi:glycosyltransferase involved in cell wall biosynthesis